MPEWDVDLYHEARKSTATLRVEADSKTAAGETAVARTFGFTVVEIRPADGTS